MKREYQAIIDMPHHVSSRHPRMPVQDRAAQFAPFAALTGHEEAVAEAVKYAENAQDEFMLGKEQDAE